MGYVIWHSDLPQDFTLISNWTQEDNLHKSKMETGNQKRRPKYSAVISIGNTQMIMTGYQTKILKLFYQETLQSGALPFEFKDMITNEPANYFIDKPPVYTPLKGDGDGITGNYIWQVDLVLRTKP